MTTGRTIWDNWHGWNRKQQLEKWTLQIHEHFQYNWQQKCQLRCERWCVKYYIITFCSSLKPNVKAHFKTFTYSSSFWLLQLQKCLSPLNTDPLLQEKIYTSHILCLMSGTLTLIKSSVNQFGSGDCRSSRRNFWTRSTLCSLAMFWCYCLNSVYLSWYRWDNTVLLH